MNNKLLYFLFFWIFFPILACASETEGVIYDASKYAWGEKTGWVNFNPSKGGVHVTDEGLTGYAWAENYGWINLSPTNTGVKNDGEGDLSGKAWNDKLGWIDFSGVSVDKNGNFSGTAGEESSDFGRLAFECNDCNVATDWRPESARSGDDDSSDKKDKKKNGSSSDSNNNSFDKGNGLQDSDRNKDENPKNNISEILKKTGSNPMFWVVLILALLFLFIAWRRRKKQDGS